MTKPSRHFIPSPRIKEKKNKPESQCSLYQDPRHLARRSNMPDSFSQPIRLNSTLRRYIQKEIPETGFASKESGSNCLNVHECIYQCRLPLKLDPSSDPSSGRALRSPNSPINLGIFPNTPQRRIHITGRISYRNETEMKT